MFQAGILSHPTRVLVLTLHLPPPATSAWSPVIKLQQLRTNTRPGMMSVYRIHLHLRLLSRYSRSWRTRSKFAHPRDTRHVKRFDTPEITRPICDVRFWGLILVDVLLPRVRGLMASRDTQWFTGRRLQVFFLVSFLRKAFAAITHHKKAKKNKKFRDLKKNCASSSDKRLRIYMQRCLLLEGVGGGRIPNKLRMEILGSKGIEFSNIFRDYCYYFYTFKLSPHRDTDLRAMRHSFRFIYVFRRLFAWKCLFLLHVTPTNAS